MPNLTPNLSLKKPLKTESYTITDVTNDNMDSIDLKVAPKANPTFTGLITTGGQIKFPATQVPSADANTLDDYEEGTFTPIVIGTTTEGVGTYTFQYGRYTKIGRAVFIDILIDWSAHTGTGSIEIGGLPFNSLSLPESVLLIIPQFITYTNDIGGYVYNLNNKIGVFTYSSNAARVALPMDTSGRLYISGHYNS